MKYYTGGELFDITGEIKQGMEFKRIGEGYCATTLKDETIFTGTLHEWEKFKKEFPEMLCTNDLLNQVV